MKRFLLFCIAIVCCGCGTPNQESTANTEPTAIPSQTSRVDKSKQMYKELFKLIDLHEAGHISDSEFKQKADSLKRAIDTNDSMLTDNEKAEVKTYGKELMDELILKKMERDNK